MKMIIQCVLQDVEMELIFKNMVKFVMMETQFQGMDVTLLVEKFNFFMIAQLRIYKKVNAASKIQVLIWN